MLKTKFNKLIEIKWSCCLRILSGENDQQSNRHKFEKEIIRLKELCTHMDITVEKLRRRPLFL